MLATLKELLVHARENNYAVPAFDCVEDIMIRTILETVEELKAPVIMMLLEMDLEADGGTGWVYQVGLLRAVADHHKIPMAIHLDHATDLELIRKAVDVGFTGVMIDGSKLPFEENVALTKAAVEIAQPRGLSVEAELGHVGGMNIAGTQCAENVLTEADEVARFIEQTGVDALAVSIGTAHGVYRAEPTLNIERLKEINTVSSVPLVLHGGSGTPDDQIREAVRGGICKLNIYADARMAMYKGLKEAAQLQERPDPMPVDLFRPIRRELAAIITEKTKLLFADNRV